MANEMIERVKAAVKAEMEVDRFPLGGWDAIYERVARAAIEALRGSSPEMDHAVYALKGGHYVIGDFPPILDAALDAVLPD